MKYKSIVISGQIASGTSTAAQNVARRLGLEYKSAGDFFRKYVIDHNIPLYDKEQIPDDVEREVDGRLTEIAKQGGHVIDAHYIGFFTRTDPEILRVLLLCQADERYKRAQEREHTHTETIEEIEKREEGLDAKFRKLYANDNFLNPKFFELVIDTTNTSQEEVSQKIINKFKED